MYGLALEGGGARGAAHVGVLRALQEHRLLPTSVAGTSAGSMVAAAYAWRGRVEDAQEAMAQCARMQNRLLDVNMLAIARGMLELLTMRNFRLEGVFKGKRLQRWMGRFTQCAQLSEAALPLVIPAVDLLSGRAVYFASREPAYREGAKRSTEAERRTTASRRPSGNVCVPVGGPPIWETQARMDQAVRASTAIPVAFAPLSYRGHQLVDGGLLENLPVHALRALGTSRVLGVVLETAGAFRAPDDVMGIGLRSIHVMQARLAGEQENEARMLLRVCLPADGGLFDFARMPAYERIGYQAAMDAMPQILRLFGPDSRQSEDI